MRFAPEKYIVVEVKNVYGNSTIYPVCDIARNFAKLLNQKTLTSENIRIIKDMGYKIEVEQSITEL